MEQWPASLPQDMLLNHNEGAMSGLVPFEPIQGPALYWQTGDAQSHPISGQVFLETNAQRATFLNFFRDTLAMGSRQFSWVSESWAGSEYVFQFAKEDAYQMQGGNGESWRLMLNLTFIREI